MAPDHNIQTVRASFGVFKPQDGYNIDDVLSHVLRVGASLEKNSQINITILKSLSRSWVAIFAQQKSLEDEENPWTNLPQAAAFTRGLRCAVRMVDSGWFELVSGEDRQKLKGEKKDMAFAKYGVGDIVSVRRIFCSGGSKQDSLVYCCLAVLKSFFTNIKGMIAYNFFRSFDGKSIIGLGKWENSDYAYDVIKSSDGCPAEVYWNSLGPKKLKYEVCEVVYVTNKSQNP